MTRWHCLYFSSLMWLIATLLKTLTRRRDGRALLCLNLMQLALRFICRPSVTLLLPYSSVPALWEVVKGKKRQCVSLYSRPAQIIYFSNSDVGHGRCLTVTLTTAATLGLNYVQLFHHLFRCQGITVAITPKSNIVTSVFGFLNVCLHIF